MNDELVAFLCAQLDADEAAAKAADEGPWELSWDGQEHQLRAPGSKWPIAEWTYAIRTYGDDVDEERADCNTADQEHIARHDPARVLREIAAKRAIIDAHNDDGWCCPVCTHEPTSGEDDFRGSYNHPCPTLRHLAAVYADRPDYRKEWKP